MLGVDTCVEEGSGVVVALAEVPVLDELSCVTTTVFWADCVLVVAVGIAAALDSLWDVSTFLLAVVVALDSSVALWLADGRELAALSLSKLGNGPTRPSDFANVTSRRPFARVLSLSSSPAIAR